MRRNHPQVLDGLFAANRPNAEPFRELIWTLILRPP
jgi:hypothetical protein